MPRTLRRCVFASLTLPIIAAAITACARTEFKPNDFPGAALHGFVLGGQQPVSQSSIQLFGVTSAASATPLLADPPVTGADGSFTIPANYTCPSAATEVYLAATAGDPGPGRINHALALVAGLGACSQLSKQPALTVNERTSVAAIAALAPFGTSLNQVSATPSLAAPSQSTLQDAFTEIGELADSGTGNVPGSTLPAGFGVPVSTVNSLADIVAACVNSPGGTAGDGSPCGNLFQLATSPGAAAPTNTADAVFDIQRNPARNAGSLFALLQPQAPFAPVLGAAPADWSIAVLPTLSLSIASPQLPAGATASATVTLGQAAPAAGLQLTLTSSNPAILSASSPLALPAGQGTGVFTLQGKAAGTVTLTASTPYYLPASSTVSVTSDVIAVDPLASLNTGSSEPLSIRLVSPAPSGGVTLALTSSDPSTAAVTPSTVPIPGGAYAPVAPPLVQGTGIGSALITVAAPGYKTASIRVQSGVSATLLQNFHAPLDQPASQTITLSGVAPPGGLAFALSSDDPTLATVPASVTIPAGAGSVSFPVTGLRVGDTTLHATSSRLGTLSASVRTLFHVCSMWGDSLTQGNEDGSGITVPTALLSTGYCETVYNEGIGGQTSVSIAVRDGVVPSTATIHSGIIPASGPTQIDMPPFPGGAVTDQGPPQFITISGVDGMAYFNADTGQYVFTRNTAGAPVPSPPNSPVTVHPPNVNSGLVIFWAGSNDAQQPDEVKADIAAMVAVLAPGVHYVVLSPIGANFGQYWAIGNTNPLWPYNVLTRLNADLAALYPRHFIDLRSIEIAAYNPANPEDVIDHDHDSIPSSFRAQDLFGTLLTAIPDRATCTFSTTPGRAWFASTITVESEKIYIDGSDGTNVTGCIRGYAGTTAAPHPSGITYTGLDAVHQSGAQGAVFTANQIVQWARTQGH